MADLPFAQGFYVSESLPISNQECVNFEPRPVETNTVTRTVLFGSQGLLERASANADEFNRGSDTLESILFKINGNKLYRVDETFDAFGVPSYNAVNVSGSESILGTERVDSASNGTQLCIIAPELDDKFNAWLFTEAGGLVRISDVDFDGPVNSVVYIAGFFLFVKKDGNKFFISSLREGADYNALDFADAEVDPDPSRAAFVLNNQLYILGSLTIEPFQNIGGAGFPFQRIEGGALQKGIFAPRSIIAHGEAMVWVGGGVNEGASIWRSSGGNPQKISTDAIDTEIQSYPDSDVSSAFALTYARDGSFFAAFTFPNQQTFVYNLTSNLWSQRESVNLDLPIPWRVSTITKAYGKLFVGDSISNKIGTIEKDVFTEYGEILRGRFTTPPFDNGGNSFSVDSIELFMETGKAPVTGLDSDPEISMEFSIDGGNTFSNPITRSLGLTGQYRKRIIWDQLGRVEREIMFRFFVSSAIKRVVIKMEGNFDG